MLQTGLIFGGIYRLKEQLGKGAMGEVWLAQHLLLDQPRAIKVMLGNFSDVSKARERFIQGEARNALRLDPHPNIVRVYELGLHENIPYIVMEYVEGGLDGADLRELLQTRGKLSKEHVGRILAQLASALEVAHYQGLVHRDVKPANILLDVNGRVKLTDFGLIKDLEAEEDLTLSGYSLGTPAYMSPEQALGEADQRSDIYSLGALTYQMLAGRLPFEGTTTEILRKHASIPPAPLEKLNPDLSPALSAVILKALAKLPQDRYQSVRAMHLAYQQALGNEQDLAEASTLAMPGRLPEEEETTNYYVEGLEAPPPCPYRGLFAFQEDDAPFFFGREAFTCQLLEAVEQKPLVAVIGPSGSGKSSVIYAGLIPRLRQENTWRVISFRPGDSPFRNLALALVSLLQAEMSETDRMLETNKLTKTLRQGEMSLTEVAAWIRRIHGGARLMIVADQFEELFTLCRDEKERQHFLEELLSTNRSSAEPGKPASFNLILTIRADFFGHALSYRPLADTLQQAQQNLGPMTLEEMQAAIEGPANKVGVALEEGLTERILEAVSDRPGDLPLLEFALTLLWDKQHKHRLTHAAYEEIGGVEKALAGYAEEIFGKLSEAECEQAQHLFVQLVRPGEGTEDTRRVANRGELAETDWELVTKLVNARLIVSSLDEVTGQETVEVAHEALILHWQRLREWVAADRKFRTWQERLRAVIKQWEASKRDEGALLRGSSLVEAEEWLNQRQASLSETERNFIQTSLVLRKREMAQKARVRRFVMLGLVAGLVITLGLAVVAMFLGVQASQERNEARFQENEARKQEHIAKSRALAANALTQFDFDQQLGILLAVEAINATRRYGEPILPQATDALRRTLMRSQLRTSLRGHSDWLTSAVYSPDGKSIVTGSYDKTAKVWDAQTYQELATLTGHTGIIWSVAYNSDGRYLVTASEDQTAKIWNTQTWQEIAILKGHMGPVTGAAFSPDGRFLVTSSADKTAKVWDTETWQEVRTLSEHTGRVNSVAFSPDGFYAITASDDGSAIVWDTKSWEVWHNGYNHKAKIYSACFSPNGLSIVTASSDGTAKVWDAASGLERLTLSGHTSEVFSAAFSPDSRAIVTSSRDETAKIWDAQTGQERTTLVGHFYYVKSAAFSPDGTTIVTASQDRTAKLWRTQSDQEQATLAGHSREVRAIAFSSDGQGVATGSDDSTVKIWDVQTKKERATLTGHSGNVYSVNYSPDGRSLVTASADGTVRVWNVEDWQTRLILKGHTDQIWQALYSPDGHSLVTACWDKTAKIWDAQTGQERLTLQGHTDRVYGAAFSPDGSRIVTASRDRTAKIWDAQTGREILTLQGHTEQVGSAVFSPDGRWIVTASADGTARIWDVQTGQERLNLRGHTGWVWKASFSPDGRWIVTASADGTARIWDAQTGQEQATLVNQNGKLRSIFNAIFSPNGQTILTANFDGTAELQLVSGEDLLKLAQERITRQLTSEERAQFGLD
jgi:WD40 repeat protein